MLDVIFYITIYLIVVMYSIFIPLQIGSITPDFFTLGIYLLLVFSNISGFALSLYLLHFLIDSVIMICIPVRFACTIIGFWAAIVIAASRILCCVEHQNFPAE